MRYSGANLYEVRRFDTVYRVMRNNKKNPLVNYQNYDAVKKLRYIKTIYIGETETLLYAKHILGAF